MASTNSDSLSDVDWTVVFDTVDWGVVFDTVDDGGEELSDVEAAAFDTDAEDVVGDGGEENILMEKFLGTLDFDETNTGENSQSGEIETSTQQLNSSLLSFDDEENKIKKDIEENETSIPSHSEKKHDENIENIFVLGNFKRFSGATMSDCFSCCLCPTKHEGDNDAEADNDRKLESVVLSAEGSEIQELYVSKTDDVSAFGDSIVSRTSTPNAVKLSEKAQKQARGNHPESPEQKSQSHAPTLPQWPMYPGDEVHQPFWARKKQKVSHEQSESRKTGQNDSSPSPSPSPSAKPSHSLKSGYGPEDVLFGRGGLSNDHIGNRIFREEARKLSSSYFQEGIKKPAKTEISNKLVKFVHDRGGRFLRFNEEEGKWVEGLPKHARVKAAQALRDSRKDGWAHC